MWNFQSQGGNVKTLLQESWVSSGHMEACREMISPEALENLIQLIPYQIKSVIKAKSYFPLKLNLSNPSRYQVRDHYTRCHYFWVTLYCIYFQRTTVYVPSSELWLSHPLSSQRVCPSPRNQRGGTLAYGWGIWGSPNSDDWRKSLALCLLCGLYAPPREKPEFLVN